MGAGRGGERARLAAVLDGVADGRGASCHVEASAGMGKSELLAWTAAVAAGRGIAVVEADGVETARDLPWAGLSAICWPFRGHMDLLARPQQRALRSALALDEPGSGEVDRLAVSLGALTLLSVAARERPTLVLVDDLPWVDAESRRAIAFLRRRVAADPIGLVTAGRPGPAVGPSVDTIPLGPLADEAVAELLAPHVRSLAARSAVVAVAGGNPLVALHLAQELDDAVRSGAIAPPAELAAPRVVDDLYRPEVAALTDEAALAVAVVALAHDSRPAKVSAALDRLEVSPAGRAAADATGLVVTDRRGPRLVHPLVRNAVVAHVDPSDQRRVHRALAEVVGRATPAGIRHAADAADRPDDALAEQLAALAQDAVDRAAPGTALGLAVDAAALAETAGGRAALLVTAAEVAVLAGDLDRARTLLDEAAATDPDQVDSLAGLAVRARLAGADGPAAEAVVDRAIEVHGDVDPVGTATVVVEVVRPLIPTNLVLAVGLTRRAWALAGGLADRPPALDLVQAIADTLDGDMDSADAHGGSWRRLIEEIGPVRAGPIVCDTEVLRLGVLRRLDEATAILDAIEGPLRSCGAATALVPLLSVRSYLTYATDLRTTMSTGAEAIELARLTEPTGQSRLALTMTMIAASMVDEDECRRLVADVEGGTDSWSVAPLWARAALGKLELILGHPEAAVSALSRAVAPHNGRIADNLPACEPDLVAALALSGRRSDAAAANEAWVDLGTSPGWADGQRERIAALLTDDLDEADRHVATGLTHFASGQHRVAAMLLDAEHGARLARAGRSSAAEAHLNRALDAATELGAGLVAQVVEDALAKDLPPRTHAAEVLAPLPLQVARLVAAGLSRNEVADRLFVSTRAVGAHVTTILATLGLDDVVALRARAADDATLAVGWAVSDEPVPDADAARPPEDDGPTRVTLLGGFALHQGDEVRPLDGLPATAVQVVALHPHGIHVDQLVEVLWPDAHEGVGRQRLRNVLARIRTAAPVIEREDTIVRIRGSVDVTDFTAAARAALAAGDAELARAALDQYQRPLLPEARHEDWAATPRERLRLLALDLVALVADAAEAEGRTTELVALAERAAEIDPDDESWWLRAAEAQLVAGDERGARTTLGRADGVVAALDLPPTPRHLALAHRLRG